MAVNKTARTLRKRSPGLFLDLYYPFHYKVGFTIEDALRGDQLTQHQTVILWIIHSEGENGRFMRRKDIEHRISTWFDVTSSAISKALRSMARPETPFLEITEDPRSGREKMLHLTDEGQAHIEEMMQRTEDFIARIVADLSDEEIRSGLHFLKRVGDVVEKMNSDQTSS